MPKNGPEIFWKFSDFSQLVESMTENELLSVTQIDVEFYQKKSVIVRKYDLLLGGDVKSQYLPCELNYSVVFCIIVALLLLA